MELLKKLLLNSRKIFFSIHPQNKKEYIFFKIVDRGKKDRYTLQCVHSKSIFHAHILEIIFDADILYRLHPLQSCFIGIEYAKYLKKNKKAAPKHWENLSRISAKTESRGQLQLKYQNRKGDICYFDEDKNAEFIMNPKDIAFSSHLIKKFHAEQAFYIGICAGTQMNNLPENIFYLDFYKNKHR